MRVIWITGASSGLGRSLALQLAQKPLSQKAGQKAGRQVGQQSGERLRLVLFGRDAERLTEVAAACRAHGAEVQWHQADISQAVQWQAALDAALAEGAPDWLIANAGVSGGSSGVADGVEQAMGILQVNLLGVVQMVEHCLPAMMAQKRGRVVLVSSLAGLRGLPTAPAYSTSKVAVRAYGDAIRPLLMRYGIGVTVVCPGFIRTPMTDVNPFPMPFLMEADDAAARMIDAIAKGRAEVLFPWVMGCAMRLMAMMPRVLVDRLLARLPAKPRG